MDVQVKIRTEDLLNTKKNGYRMRQFAVFIEWILLIFVAIIP